MKSLPRNSTVAVLGAGPVGLAAAAHLVARGYRPIVFEQGAQVGANLLEFAHVKLFSPWRYNVDRTARGLLLEEGWREPDADVLPSAGELVDQYLAPLANLRPIKSALKLNHRVLNITRAGFDKVKSAGREEAPFVLRVDTGDEVLEFRADAVLDASGTWSQPNPLGASGLPAQGEAEHAAYISYGMPDVLGAQRRRYAGKRVLVVGAGHSAAGNLIALAQLAQEEPRTRLVWALRGQSLGRSFGGGEADALPARGRIGTRLRGLKEAGLLEIHTGFRTRQILRQRSGLSLIGEPVGGTLDTIEAIDEIIVATGARPDLALTRELRLNLDTALESAAALAPLIDPNEHSCGTVRPHGRRELTHPETGFYAIGAKSYGRAPTFLMATGYEQARSVVAALAGDLQAADDVQLDLPETGVCGVAGADGEGACCAPPRKAAQAAPPSAMATDVTDVVAETGCCGGKPPEGVDACCVKDADEKAKGNAGCGCDSEAAPAKPKAAAACC
jgi:hypothetical protein